MAAMKKGGSMLVFIAIITLIAALIVGMAYYWIATNYASGDVALKTAAAKDIALILDTMYAYTYNLEIEYNIDLSKFKVEISNSYINVYDKSYNIPNTDPTLARYSFVPVKNSPSIFLDAPQKITFKKENGILTATK